MPAPSPPRLPVGISDFRQLREPGVLYVDKTDFITEVLSTARAAVLIPRPRRFGKTVNMSTLRYFVEKSSEDRSALFEGLGVWRSAEARAHFQRYPVIAMTFKDIKEASFEDAFRAIRRVLSEVYREHAYLLAEGILTPDQEVWFRQILASEGPKDLYARSLADLSAHLARHHGERVFLLIDEYDAPIHSIAKGEDERRLLDFFRAFLSGGLKDNSNLFKGVLTGILRIAKESLFSGLNNLVVHSLLRPACATSFGFTEAEVRDLAAVTGNEAMLPEIERWYNGYRFGGHVIYNPWSVINFLDSEDKVLRPYWVQTSSEEVLRRVIFAHGMGQSGEVEALLAGGEIEKRVDERVALRDLDQRSDAVWSFLLFTGYLKATAVRMDEAHTVATLAIPNKEVRYVYETLFQSWLEQRIGSGHVDELMRAVVSGDAPTCERLLCVLLQSLSLHDLPGPRPSSDVESDAALTEMTPEKLYQVFVVTLLLGLQPHYHVRSNRESGGGRCDVMILPRTPGRPGVVLELKVRDRRRRETVKAAMAAALGQIRERDYAAELRAAGAAPIHEIGVVFDRKDAWVEVAAPPSPPRRASGPARRKARTSARKVTAARRDRAASSKKKRN